MRQIESIVNEDTLLLEKIKGGNKEAFNILFEKYWEKAYSDAFKRLRNEDDAKDVVQEIFARMWINRQIQTIENLPAYIHVAIRNNVIKLLTKQKPTHPFFDVLNNISEKNSQADKNLLWKEFYDSYEVLLKTLPRKRQIIFRLRYHEDLCTKDISKRLGITRKTVQNQLRKAIDTLKVSLLRIFIVVVMLLISVF